MLNEKRTVDIDDNSDKESSSSISSWRNISRYRDESPLMNNSMFSDFENSTAFDDIDYGLIKGTRHRMGGPSRHDYVYGNRMRNWNEIDIPEFDDLGDDRAEAFQELDGRSGNLIDKGKLKVPVDTRMMHRDVYARENYCPDFEGRTYQRHYAESFPRPYGPKMGGDRFYPPRLHKDYAPYQAYMSGVPYGDAASVPHYVGKMRHFSHHLPLCSCYQCLDGRQVPFPPTAYCSNVPSGKMFEYHVNPGSLVPWDPSHLISNGGTSHLNYEADAFVNQNGQRGRIAASSEMNVRHRRPMAGGAPFLTCCSCFELLVLPKRVETKGCNKIRCASCSMTISVILSSTKENKSITSAEAENHNMVSIKNLDREKRVVSSDGYDYGFSSEEWEFSVGQQRDKLPTYTEVEEDTENSISVEKSGEGDKLKHSVRSGESLRSINNSNRTSEILKAEKVSVTVNGQLITNELVAIAEKLAGRIQPGNYWYDFRAGFWGVEGGPCLGIIPPYIEEFNYPMPINCSAGNAKIFVNGRELNDKDLNLLASRGLPTESHKSYIIEISGRVLDEDSGEELESLGKLAPIVERAKHGFGMKVPKTAA